MHRARYARWVRGAAAIACLHFGPAGCSAAGAGPSAGAGVGAGVGLSANAGAGADAGAGAGTDAGAGAGTDAGAGLSGESAPLFPVCSDGQILAILGAEFAARVGIAGALRANLVSPVAVDLAEKILTDDSVLQVQVEGEVRETGIAAAPGGIGREIAAEAQGAIEALTAESGPALDASYVDREALAHLRALGLIDRLLAPSVHDPRVLDLLSRVRELVVEHAQAAIEAQAELEGACASSSAPSAE
jgi:predicted outer membrane protein